jgi:hypothetical protein
MGPFGGASIGDQVVVEVISWNFQEIGGFKFGSFRELQLETKLLRAFIFRRQINS